VDVEQLAGADLANAGVIEADLALDPNWMKASGEFAGFHSPQGFGTCLSLLFEGE